MKKIRPPLNSPRLICEECKNIAPAHEKWANDNQGQVFLVEMDMWPTYYQDVAGIRVEFCSCLCGTKWLQKKRTEP
jgi:hypothetical protein